MGPVKTSEPEIIATFITLLTAFNLTS